MLPRRRFHRTNEEGRTEVPSTYFGPEGVAALEVATVRMSRLNLFENGNTSAAQ